VNEVKEGYECGIGIENFNDVKIGDVFECYRTEEVARTLDQASKS
jgi:translation initiation factor IF-2